MNRAERRRQQKQAKKAARSLQSGRSALADDLRTLFHKAAQLHQVGQRAEAETLCRQILAAALAGDADRLGHYRRTLRPALQASSLLDADQHVAELEDAYRVMWRRWCDGLAPEGFAVAG